MTLTPTLTLTLHLIDAEQAIRRRVPGGVNLAVAQGRPTSPSIDPDEAKRGPGMYDLSQNAVLPSPKATDFSKAQGRPLDSPPKVVKDGDRLILFPNLDILRPAAPSTLIPSEHEAMPRRRRRWNKEKEEMEDIDEEPDEYFHAVYEPNVSAVKRNAPKPRDFGTMLGREGEVEGVRTSGRLLDYHVEDVPLTVLAGFKSAPRAPNFKTMVPHRALIPESESNLSIC